MEVVLNALRSLKEREVLEAPTAVALLDRTIEAVEENFTSDLTEGKAWNILFPQ
ncbi:hypothetical protein DXG03_002895 [Asterophora parasitica]|uniref:Uncharacterized protein n=1 Tax=Asterophora parasitica TaxID=117018 RepID=A0A9P7KG87_9AGAR|nr:hypothetical protein DXG03_002895 [Asterophora parasitica]